jgi:hypothetical protein
MMQVASQPRAGTVSCDIIGHSPVGSRDVQAERVEAINAILPFGSAPAVGQTCEYRTEKIVALLLKAYAAGYR